MSKLAEVESIEKLLESWARWRCDRVGAELGYGPTVIGRMIDGLPSTKCTRCDGSGDVVVENIHKHKIKTACPRCDGLGKIKSASTAHKINPAFISGTGARFENPIYHKIDRAVCDLKYMHQIVVMSEFCESGTYEIKSDKMGVSRKHYSRILKEAITILEEKLYAQKVT